MTPEQFQELKEKFGADNPAVILVDAIGCERVHYECAVKHCEAAAEEVSVEEMLVQYCKDFIKENEIHCSETIYQTDRVSENAPKLVEGICSLLGFYNKEKDEVCL